MIVIKRTLDRELENSPIKDNRILQGNFSNLKFVFKLADNGEPVTIVNASDLSVIVNPTRNNINYIIPTSQVSVTNDEVTINGCEVLVNQCGNHNLVIQLSSLYTFSTSYFVNQNIAYEPKPISIQDHSDFATKTDLLSKLNIDLSNADNNARWKIHF